MNVKCFNNNLTHSLNLNEKYVNKTTQNALFFYSAITLKLSSTLKEKHQVKNIIVLHLMLSNNIQYSSLNYVSKKVVGRKKDLPGLMIRCSEGCERRALNSALLQLSSHQKRNSQFTFHLNRPTNKTFTYESYWILRHENEWQRRAEPPDRLIYHQSSNRYMVIVFENVKRVCRL